MESGSYLYLSVPTELPDTTLAQCGTIISLRLSNSEDQNTIRAALPDVISGLAGVLPSLRTGEGVISGESVYYLPEYFLTCPARSRLPTTRP